MKLYLEQLIYSLHDSDIERLKKMDLKKSKIKTYLEILIESRKTGVPGNEVIQKNLDLDESSFKKMRSILLSKCLKELVPEGGGKLLYFLSRYRLQEIFSRKAADMFEEIELTESFSPGERAEIYLQSTLGYMRLPFSLFDKKKSDKYFAGFQSNYNLPDKPVLTEVIKLNEIIILIVQSFFRLDTSEKNYFYFLKKIKPVEEKAELLKNKRLKIFVKVVHLILDFYYKEKWTELEEEFENVIKTYSTISDESTNEELFLVRFYKAYNQIMLNNYRKANELFEELENEYPALFEHTPKAIFRYAMSLLIAGENKKCKKIIDRYLKKNILLFDMDRAVKSATVITLYHLLENELDEVQKYMDLFWTVIDKKKLFGFETGMRIFEIAYFYQRGDEAFAGTQLKGLARYLNDKSDRKGVQQVITFVKILEGVFKQLRNGEINLSGFESGLTNLFQRNQSIFSTVFINAAKVRNGSLVEAKEQKAVL